MLCLAITLIKCKSSYFFLMLKNITYKFRMWREVKEVKGCKEVKAKCFIDYFLAVSSSKKANGFNFSNFFKFFNFHICES